MPQWMDRWAAHAQRKSDERAARWRERQREKARSGRITAADRFAASAQRKSDERAARWQELEPLRQLLTSGPITGPDDSSAVIRVDQTGASWLARGHFVPTGGSGGGFALVALLITELIWWLVFRRSYTIHVRTNGRPPIKIHRRMPSEIAAYRAAAQLVMLFHDKGPAALHIWQADDFGTTNAVVTRP